MGDQEFDGLARLAAIRRRRPDAEIISDRNAYLAQQDDWYGTCHFCKQKFTGTMADLVEHRCPGYEAQCEKGN
jgi:hypothetical protein